MGKNQGDRSRLRDGEQLIGCEVMEPLDATGGPGDLNFVDGAHCVPESKVQGAFVLAEEVGAAIDKAQERAIVLVHAQADDGANPVAIGARPDHGNFEPLVVRMAFIAVEDRFRPLLRIKRSRSPSLS